MLQRIGQGGVGNEFAGDADTLVEADQMRGGVDMYAQSGRFADRAQEGACAALAVGAGDVDDRRQAFFGMAQFRQ